MNYNIFCKRILFVKVLILTCLGLPAVKLNKKINKIEIYINDIFRKTA